MAIVNLIKINAHSGALVADEEFWRQGHRRTLSLDNLQPLLPESFCEHARIAAVIGVEGDPSITYEAILCAQKKLKEIITNPDKNPHEEPIRTIREVAEITVGEINKLIRKRIDDQLQFAYGFTTDDLNQGFFEEGGDRIDIKQNSIRSDALRWTRYDHSFSKTRALFETDVLIAGVDSVSGFHWFEWSGVTGSLFLGSGQFESIGKGSDAANLAFIDIFRKRHLMERRRGMSLEEGLFSLIEALEAAVRFNHEVGGYPQFAILDGTGQTHKERFREYSGHGAKLALEIVTAYVHGFLPKKDALNFIGSLILKDADFREVEETFFKSVKDSRTLEHFLRGFKTTVPGARQEAVS